MNVVDSSAWLEFLADGPNADAFAEPIQNTEHLVVPTLSIYEVFKKTLRLRGEDAAVETATLMRQGRVIHLDEELAMEAARLSLRHTLPLADSIILATARDHGATLWTQDSDFEGLRDVRYHPKKK